MKFAGLFVACLLTLTLTACEQKKAAPAAAQPATAEAKAADAKPGEAKAEEKKEEKKEEQAEAPDTHGMPGMGDLFKGKDGK